MMRTREYEIGVHVLASSHSPCSANSILLRAADGNGGRFNPVTTDTLRHNAVYVDNLLKSVPTPKDAITLMEQLIELSAKGGFNVAKSVSNNRKVFSAIPQAKRADSSLDVSLNELPLDRALVVRWQKESDTFGFMVTQ